MKIKKDNVYYKAKVFIDTTSLAIRSVVYEVDFYGYPARPASSKGDVTQQNVNEITIESQNKIKNIDEAQDFTKQITNRAIHFGGVDAFVFCSKLLDEIEELKNSIKQLEKKFNF